MKDSYKRANVMQSLYIQRMGLVILLNNCTTADKNKLNQKTL